MKTLWALCFGALCCVSCTKSRPHVLQPTLEGLHDAMEKRGMFALFPDDPTLRVIFFTAQDDIPWALVTSKDHMYRDGCTWHDYVFKDGQWQRGPTKISEITYTNPVTGVASGPVDPSNCLIEAGMDEFYIWTEKGQKPKFVVIHDHGWRGGIFKDDDPTTGIFVDVEEYYLATRTAKHITIDPEGYLKTIPIPELSFEKRRFEYDDGDDIKDYPTLQLETPTYKLEPIQVQTFSPKTRGLDPVE